jgi:hypothetical protein
MKALLALICLFTMAQAQDLTLHSKTPNKGIAGAYHSEFFDPIQKDKWLDPYRALTVIDSLQTWSLKDAGGREYNQIYRGMNGPESGVLSLAIGWGAERFVTGLPSKEREIAGWLLVAVRVFDVIYNADHGVTLWTIRF